MSIIEIKQQLHFIIKHLISILYNYKLYSKKILKLILKRINC